MNDEVVCNDIAESNNDCVNMGNEDKRSFFDYLKKNPAVAIAIVTGFVAVFSFITNMAVFLYEKMYLLYWEIDSTYIVSGSTNMVYTVLSSLALSVAVLLSLFVVNQIYCKNADDISFCYYCKLLVNRIRSDSRRLRWRCCKLLFKSIFFKGRRKDRSEIKKIINNCNERIKSGKALIKPYVKRCNKRAALCFVLVFIVLFIIGFVMYMTLPDYIGFSDKVLLALFTSLMPAVKVIIESAKSNVNKKQIRELAKKDYDSDIKLNEEALKECYKKYKPFEPTANDTFISVSLAVCWMLISVLIIFSVFGYLTASFKNTFEIMEKDLISYAVIYKNTDFVILEQVEENDGTLVVFTSEQTIEKYSKMTYELRSFENVKRTTALFPKNESTIDEMDLK